MELKSILRAGIFWTSAFFILSSQLSCAGPKPIEDLVLAQTALKAAKDAGAASEASAYWYQAEENFRKGSVFMRDNYNYDAKEAFVRAKYFAEKAENVTRLKKFKSGESFP